MTSAEKEALAQKVESDLAGYFRTPPDPNTRYVASQEAYVALRWITAAIYRWLKDWAGKQVARVYKVETWWEKNKRSGSFVLMVVHGTTKKTYTVEAYAATERYLSMRISDHSQILNTATCFQKTSYTGLPK